MAIGLTIFVLIAVVGWFGQKDAEEQRKEARQYFLTEENNYE